MSEEALQEFYKYVLLPQFGIENAEITWKTHEALGPDVSMAHYFGIAESQYVLIFQDYWTFNDSEIKDLIKLPSNTFEYVPPVSEAEKPPIYHLGFPAPFKFAANVTGYFALLKI